ncbi:hypothetical protein AVEN_78810-1, partial [Araneus ventricosus]
SRLRKYIYAPEEHHDLKYHTPEVYQEVLTPEDVSEATKHSFRFRSPI